MWYVGQKATLVRDPWSAKPEMQEVEVTAVTERTVKAGVFVFSHAGYRYGPKGAPIGAKLLEGTPAEVRSHYHAMDLQCAVMRGLQTDSVSPEVQAKVRSALMEALGHANLGLLRELLEDGLGLLVHHYDWHRLAELVGNPVADSD